MTTPEKAGLTEHQREINRLRWLLIEAAARASIEVTTGGINAMAKFLIEVMRENAVLLVWMSAFEEDVNGGNT